jgi:hypothetical protein
MLRTARLVGMTTLTYLLLLEMARAQVGAQGVAPTPYTYVPVYTSPYGGYSSDPYGSYLRGAAEVIRAQAQFMVGQQEGAKLRQEVRQARFETRRKELEQWLWERERLPTPEDERQRRQREELRRSLNDPPITEIWSAKALNDLLAHAQKIDARVPSDPLNQERLARIHVTSGKYGGNLGLLKEGRPTWPSLLSWEMFRPARSALDPLIAEALIQARQGEVDAELLKAIHGKAQDLHQQLVASAYAAGNEARWTPIMYVDAKHFLDQLDKALIALQQPNVKDYLTGKYAAQGKTVADLVRYLKENGLRIAPATPGSEEAYTALHLSLAKYVRDAGAAVQPTR